MEHEIWKDIKGYEGYYQVSNLGMVRSLEQKELEDRYYEQVRPRVNPFIGGLVGEFVTDAND